MYIGDFIITKKSKLPGLIINNNVIINENSNNLIVSIIEFKGDYIILNKYEVKKSIISPLKALIILANFNNWFYQEHKDIYNEKIIDFAFYYKDKFTKLQ